MAAYVHYGWCSASTGLLDRMAGPPPSDDEGDDSERHPPLRLKHRCCWKCAQTRVTRSEEHWWQKKKGICGREGKIATFCDSKGPRKLAGGCGFIAFVAMCLASTGLAKSFKALEGHSWAKVIVIPNGTVYDRNAYVEGTFVRTHNARSPAGLIALVVGPSTPSRFAKPSGDGIMLLLVVLMG